jgi:hypothetical protein
LPGKRENQEIPELRQTEGHSSLSPLLSADRAALTATFFIATTNYKSVSYGKIKINLKDF